MPNNPPSNLRFTSHLTSPLWTSSISSLSRPSALTLFLLGVFLLGACNRADRARREPVVESPTQDTVQIAQVGDFFLYAPLYIAQDAHLFERFGIVARIQSTGGDDKSWAAVMSGSADFGIGDPAFVPIAATRGQEGRVVAAIVNGVPFWGVAFDQRIPAIERPEMLRGLVVATFPSPSTAYTLQKNMFEEGNVPPRIRELAFGALLPAVQRGQADVALELEPNVSSAVAQGARVVYSLADRYGDFAITGLTTTPEMLTHHTGRVQRVVCALAAATEMIRNDQGQALRLLKQRFPEVTDTVASSALARVTGAGIIPRTLAISDSAWTRAVSLRQAVGDLAPGARTTGFVENRFAEAAQTGNTCNELAHTSQR